MLPLSVTIEGTTYTVGDNVELVMSDGHILQKGIVAFGKFYAEIYTIYGFYVADEFGNQISEAGLTEEYSINNNLLTN